MARSLTREVPVVLETLIRSMGWLLISIITTWVEG